MTISTETQSKSTILTAYSHFGGCCRVEFTEDGFMILSDTRTRCKDGYLHIGEDSAETITDACRDQMIRYFFEHRHQDGEPGLGATPQHRYFTGLSTEDFERIGNGGHRGCYA